MASRGGESTRDGFPSLASSKIGGNYEHTTVLNCTPMGGPIKPPLVQFTHTGGGGPEPAARGEGLSGVIRRLAPESQCRAGDGG